MKTIKVVFIGVGYRGKQLLRLIRTIPCFRVAAVADPGIGETHIDGIPCYNRGEEDYLTMLREQQPDIAFITSPWRYHTLQAARCLEAGCHVALEIKGGLCLNEYQPLIEQIHAHTCGHPLKIYPLENTLFMRENLSVYNLATSGVLGEIVYMRGGYRHDLRHLLIDEKGRLGNPRKPEGTWRSVFYQTENGDLYPTHGLAPLCLIAGINRNDHIRYLTSFASRPAGMLQRIRDLGGDDTVKISTGDVVVTQLETESGVLISLTHDTTLPRPRSLDFEVQGTKGIWQGDQRRIHIEGASPDEEWEPDDKYIARYEHLYWKQWGEEALRTDTHHKGMDYIMLRAIAADQLDEYPYPVDIHDLALWTSVSPYSKLSIAERRTISLPAR